MFAKKVVIAFALCVVIASAATECNKLLNCKACKDETHCKTCPDGYKLDSNEVCRYDCSKYGPNCTSCSDKKCFCPAGKEWDSSARACVSTDCTDKDGEACSYCGKKYAIVDQNGKCSTCKDTYGTGCLTCNGAKCLTVSEGYKIYGAVAVKIDCEEPCLSECSDLFPGCTTCKSDNSACEVCSNDTVLVNGFCKYKMPTCESGEKPLYIDGKFKCGSCAIFDSDCVPTKCSGSGCTMCKTGFGLTSKGTCVNCSKNFEGCGLCTGEQCTKCRSSSWILTPNGCFNQNPYVKPSESNAGMIAGIVIACIVLVAIIVLAVYCIIAASSKKGQVDPALYEEDFEFKSMSVL